MGYPKWQSIPRLYNETFQITEKIDGTNGLIYIEGYPNDGSAYPDAPGVNSLGLGFNLFAGSRKRWITPEQDNHGFARWAYDNAAELAEKLGTGHHYGEWAGPGINKNRHKLDEKTFFLFNVKRWRYEHLPQNVRTVPTLALAVDPDALMEQVQWTIDFLPEGAEGIVVRSDLTGQQWKYFVGGEAANAASKGRQEKVAA